MFRFKRNYVVEMIHDNGGLTKIVLHGTKKDIQKDLEYYKSKAYWWEELGNGAIVMRTNQPV